MCDGCPGVNVLPEEDAPLVGMSDADPRTIVAKAEQGGFERCASSPKAKVASTKKKRQLKPLKEGHNRCIVCNRAIKQPQTIGPVCLRKQDAAAARAESEEQSHLDSQ